ncbi:MAG: helix-turn-helix domain-containing protein [Candidatus Dormibacteria bacterium]
MLVGTTEGFSLTQEERRQTLAADGLVHSHPEAVRAPLFLSGNPFFFAPDKVQTKYEMLRAHLVDRVPVITAAREHGYSRAAFYLVAEAFEEQGMKGLLDDRRGRHGPLKVTPEILEFLRAAQQHSGARLSREVAEQFGVVLHRRTLERLRRT